MNRRFFLQSSLFVSALASLPKKVIAWNDQKNQNARMLQTDHSPIATVTDPQSVDYNGDDITRPHDILWNKDEYLKSKGGRPQNFEQTEVVVIGGGMAGLLSAYHLQDLKPIVLEQDVRFGGNSRGEKFKDSQYSIGAAYFCVPDEGSLTEKLLQDLDLAKYVRHEEDTSVRFKHNLNPGFWKGSTDPKAKDQFEKFNSMLADILEKSYPAVPHDDEGDITRDQLNALDSISFEQWLKDNFGEVHPHIKEYMQLYAWSSFGGSISEISAAQMLNFVTAETAGIVTLPGGNSAISKAVVEKLKALNGPETLRAGSIVIDVVHDAQGVEVIYEDAAGSIQGLRAKACVMASPKFVAKFLINGIPPEQRKAMDAIVYRGYVVANVILNKRIESPTYELYSLEGEVPEVPMAMSPPKRDFTDICFGTWAAKDQVENTVLTMYMALPYDGARQFLFSPMSHQKYQTKVEKVLPDVLKMLNLTPADVAGVRLTRWGHSMPLARTGMIASGMAEKASAPIAGKVFFAQQDNWVNPCLEVCQETAVLAAEQVREALKK